MRFTWNQDTIRWLCDASAYTAFHARLAEKLRPGITPGGTLVDLGCGIGQIDSMLAGAVKQITCVDRAKEPLEFLQRRAIQGGVYNLETLQADSHTLTGLWDDALTLFHGAGEGLVTRFLPLCRNRLTAVVRSGETSPFGPAQWRMPHQDLAAQTQQALEALGAVFSQEAGELEYGQPLNSREEAAAFVRAGCPNIPAQALEEFLDGHLEELDASQWRFYLPNRKKFTIFTLPRAENEHLLSGKSAVS